MKKRTVSLLLAAALCLTLFPVGAFAEDGEGNGDELSPPPTESSTVTPPASSSPDSSPESSPPASSSPDSSLETPPASSSTDSSTDTPSPEPTTTQPPPPTPTPTQHQHFGGSVQTIAATCKAEGKQFRICYECKQEYDVVTLPKVPHTFANLQTIPATCKAEGKKYRICPVCGKEYDVVILSKLDHLWGVAVTTAPTCKTPGKQVKTCSLCHETQTETIPVTANHTWGSTRTVKATCTTEGKIARTCTVCGEEQITQRLPKTSHEYEARVTTPATLSQEGVRTYTCKNCKTTYTEVIPRGGLGSDDVVLGVGLTPDPRVPGGYHDLREDHWAFNDMEQAAQMGILQGTGQGMEPNGTLTWAQGLTLAARTFAPDLYLEETAAGTAWDTAAYRACLKAGILLPAGEEFLPISEDAAALAAPIDRLNTLALLSRAIPEKVQDSARVEWVNGQSVTVTAESTLQDFSTVPAAYRDSVNRLFNLSILNGAESYDAQGNAYRRINGSEVLHRCDGAALFMRGLSKLDSVYYSRNKDVTIHFIDESGTRLCPSKVTSSYIGQSVYYLAYQFLDESPELHYYRMADVTSCDVSTACAAYTAVLRPMTQEERGYQEFEDKVDRGEATWEDEWKEDYNRYVCGENLYKYQLLFGTTEKRRYSDKTEASQHQTTVSIPVWKINKKGEKYGTTVSLSINAAIAEDVVKIFTEIYNDPEQFPIADIGGYAWRGDTATGEHNTGTAIDINPTQNYQVRNGKALVGSYWKPGEDPYSIAENGSVVRIFEKYGWSWGGNAWENGNSDQTTGYHDYMHLSYMGW